jgi:hypothetical protein
MVNLAVSGFENDGNQVRFRIVQFANLTGVIGTGGIEITQAVYFNP